VLTGAAVRMRRARSWAPAGGMPRPRVCIPPCVSAMREIQGISVAAIRGRDEVALAAPPERVFAVLADFAGYARWWPWFVRVEPVALTPELVGSTLLLDPLGAPTFEWRVERVEPARLLRLRYQRGPYAGTGEWSLAPGAPSLPGGGSGTRVGYAVDVTTSHPLLQPLGRVVDLGLVHSLLMTQVLRGLAARVGEGGR